MDCTQVLAGIAPCKYPEFRFGHDHKFPSTLVWLPNKNSSWQNMGPNATKYICIYRIYTYNILIIYTYICMYTFIFICIYIYVYIHKHIPWTSRPWEFPGSMGIHGVFRENTVHLIFQGFFPAWSALESIMQYKITHNPDMWCQGSCGCQMQILNFYNSDLSGDVTGWKKNKQKFTNFNPCQPMKNPRDLHVSARVFHGYSMGSARVGYSQCIPFS